MLLRLIALAVYIGAPIGLRSYVRAHPPSYEDKFVSPLKRFCSALLRMWGPLLYFLPGLLWINMRLPVSNWAVIGFVLLAPLCIFLSVLGYGGVFPSLSESLLGWLIAIGMWGSSLIGTLAVLGSMTMELWMASPSGFEMLKFALFLIFVLFPPLVAVMVLLVGGEEVIPLAPDEKQRMRKALQLLTGFFSTYPKPSWVVEDGEVKTRIKGSSFYGVGPGWLMTEPENVVVLKSSTTLTRVAGPGIVLTAPRESPYKVVDLRNQFRVTRTKVMTRDGIEVSSPISSLFRVHSGNKKLDLESLKQQQPWPYRDPQDIFQLVLAEEVDPTGKTPLEAYQARPWDEVPLQVAINQLKQVVAQYSLDEIYSLNPTTGMLTRSIIAGKVREHVRETVEPLGLEILGGGVGNKVVPLNEGVVKQRVEAWKARWVNKILEWQTVAEVKRLDLLTKVRSKARTDLLSGLLEKTNTMLADPDKAGDVIAYHLLESLIHMAQDPRVQPMLSESAVPTLLKLSQMTGED